MKVNDVQVGKSYMAKVNGRMVTVKVLARRDSPTTDRAGTRRTRTRFQVESAITHRVTHKAATALYPLPERTVRRMKAMVQDGTVLTTDTVADAWLTVGKCMIGTPRRFDLLMEDCEGGRFVVEVAALDDVRARTAALARFDDSRVMDCEPIDG